MGKKYKVPLHIKNYIKTELYDYEKNKKLILSLEKNTSTRTFLLAIQRINKIDKVLNNLQNEDKEAVKKIFFKIP